MNKLMLAAALAMSPTLAVAAPGQSALDQAGTMKAADLKFVSAQMMPASSAATDQVTTHPFSAEEHPTRYQIHVQIFKHGKLLHEAKEMVQSDQNVVFGNWSAPSKPAHTGHSGMMLQNFGGPRSEGTQIGASFWPLNQDAIVAHDLTLRLNDAQRDIRLSQNALELKLGQTAVLLDSDGYQIKLMPTKLAD